MNKKKELIYILYKPDKKLIRQNISTAKIRMRRTKGRRRRHNLHCELITEVGQIITQSDAIINI
jgi:hypothetical protein